MIAARELACSAGDFRLRGVNLTVDQGEYFVLLGRPGSGKTVLLECLAGLRRIGAGTIELGGRPVEQLEPAARGVGYVPQDYALFSRMSVAQNIAFGPRALGWGRAERTQRVEELAELLGIGYLLGRGTRGLSGGERQRVALARALAARPEVLLLDEPANSLDPETRDEVLGELKRIQRETGTTTIHVCHDLEEMRAVADRLAILDAGRCVQVGTPTEVTERPASPQVARLLRLGSIVAARVLPCGEVDLGPLGKWPYPTEGPHGGSSECAALIRSERVQLGEGPIEARVARIITSPTGARVDLMSNGAALRADVDLATSARSGVAVGESLRIGLREGAIVVFPCEQS